MRRLSIIAVVGAMFCSALLAASCREEPAAGASETLLETIPDPVVADLAREALAAAADANERCGDLEDWAEATADAAEKTRRVGEAASVSDSMGDWRGGENATLLTEVFRDQLVIQVDCVDGATTGEVDGAVRAAVVEAFGANDDLRAELRAPNPVGTTSEFWFHSNQLGHVQELLMRSGQGDPVDILFIGSSTVIRGLDPQLVEASTGRSTFNAGVAGLYSEVAPAWWSQLQQIGVHPSTVIIGYTPFEEFLGCSPSKVVRDDDASRLRARAFSSIPALRSSVAEIELLVDGYEGVLRDDYDKRFMDRGLTVPAGALSDSDPRLIEQRDLYRRQLSTPSEGCLLRSEAFDEFVGTVRATGADVVVVAMPLHPDLVDFHPDGIEGFAEPLSGAAAIADRHGATFLDDSTALSAEDFLDLTHANAEGRTVITERVLAELGHDGSR